MNEEIKNQNEVLETVNEDTISDSTEITENITNESEVDVVEELGSTALTPVAKKLKKHLEAKKLVEEAKSMAHDSANEMQDCKVLLENDLRDYEDAKIALHSGGLDDAKALLVELGHNSVSDLEVDEEEAIFDADDAESIEIKDISSGKFTGFILSLLTGVVTFIGLIYLATQKLAIVLDVTKMPDTKTSSDISNWFSSLVGVENNAEVGMAIIALIVLVVMVLVYALRVGLKSGSNLRFANHQMKETQKYITHKANCKIEMDRVDVHITDAINTLNDYQLLLNEKCGTLKRILHFEGVNVEKHGYTHSSLLEMKETQHLIGIVQDFIMQPMSNEGKLSEDTMDSLHQAKEEVQTVLSKLSQSVA